MLRFRNHILRKSFVCSLIACAIFTYIYLEISINSKPTLIIPTDSDEDLMTQHTPTSISQDNIKLITNLKRQIKKINNKQLIQNVEHYGHEVALVIVIQVHDKKHYLEQLLQSLEHAKGITKTLLIFSHSYCDNDINILIRNTTFAKIMQIFYPYSVQLHPNVFPGNDHKICSDIMKCKEGNRKPLVMQTKHHWWWKAAFVFDELRIIKKYNASVLFLEEDQYVTQDFIYVLKVLEKLVNTSYPHCDVITLGGSTLNLSNYHVQDAIVTVKPWSPTEYIGIVFNRIVWNTMKSLTEHYCRYNDYSWINSLIYLSHKTTLGNFYAMSMDSPRIFQFSECVNSNGTSCNVTERIDRVKKFVKRIRRGLYPQNMIVRETTASDKIISNEGWKDARDQELCLLYTSNLKNLAYK